MSPLMAMSALMAAQPRGIRRTAATGFAAS